MLSISLPLLKIFPPQRLLIDFVFDARHDFADFCVFHAASRNIGRFASMKDRNTVLAAGRKYK